MKNEEVIEYLVETNNDHYQLIKATEELSELTTAILQYVTKDGNKTTKQDVIDEIGDVKIRLAILEKVFGEEQCNERYEFKLNKFSNYIENQLYVGTI